MAQESFKIFIHINYYNYNRFTITVIWFLLKFRFNDMCEVFVHVVLTHVHTYIFMYMYRFKELQLEVYMYMYLVTGLVCESWLAGAHNNNIIIYGLILCTYPPTKWCSRRITCITPAHQAHQAHKSFLKPSQLPGEYTAQLLPLQRI